MNLTEVLRSGRQADPDGVEVTISREAVETAADTIERLQRERDNLYRCVQWYADGNHADLPDWEPPDEPNWLCPPTEIEGEELMPPGSWTPDAPPPKRHTIHISPSWLVEDGSIARAVLNGAPFPADFGESEEPISAQGCTPLAPPVESSKGNNDG